MKTANPLLNASVASIMEGWRRLYVSTPIVITSGDGVGSMQLASHLKTLPSDPVSAVSP